MHHAPLPVPRTTVARDQRLYVLARLPQLAQEK